MQPDSKLINADVKQTIDLYVSHRCKTGGFVNAVLENNLTEAIARADSDNLPNLPHIVCYCYNEIPPECWGSPKKVKEWYNKEKETV
jgi:hypothetical protein